MRSIHRALLGSALILGVFAAALLAAGAQERTWDGHITDTMCGKSHMMDGMSHPECAIACQEMGASLALYVASEDKVYAIANQEDAQPHAGTDVVVTGTLGDDGETVTILRIEPR